MLPVGNYPVASGDAPVPYWIIGAALPSDMLLTKMWWPPVIALAGAVWTDRKTIATWRPTWTDIPMFLWCVWPIGQWLVVERADPNPWISCLYITAAWGVPWVLGRIYFGGSDGSRTLITAIVAGLAVLTPIALLEGVFGSQIYGWLYEPHPFRFDGQQRYIGFRPLGFFENGNQYGIWVAATALAAIWLWQNSAKSPSRRGLAAVAALAVSIAIMSQSVGSIFLLFAALAMMWMIGRPKAGWVLAIALLVMATSGAIYLSGVIPLRAIADHTVVGRQIVEFVKSTGRGSFTWRIARDQRALPIIGAHPLVGTGQWDWWRVNGERPWGLALLIFGQFGLIGLLLAFSALLTPVRHLFAIYWRPGAWRIQSEVPLALIILMSVGDALLNSFFFYPAIAAAGALASEGKGIGNKNDFLT